MKRIANLLAGMVLAFAAQAALSEQVPQDGPSGVYGVVSLLESLGLASQDGFPSRGGPIDD